MLRIALVVTVLTLAVPAAAGAATYTVTSGQGPCGGADLQCGSLAEAATAVVAGDVVELAPGQYASATFTVGGVTVKGTAAGVTVNGSLTFSGSAGGVAKLQRVVISRTATAGPALEVSGAAGLELSDSLVVSVGGHGALFSGGAANKVERSTLATAAPGSDAVRVQVGAGVPAQAFTIDSSIVAGGAAGLAARTVSSALEAAPGNITVTARHLTAAASTDGVVVDSSGAQRLIDPGVGNIAANVSDSIILNGTVTRNFVGVLRGSNTATLGLTRTRQDGDPAALFANPARFDFHLRADSPAIDQGGFTAGESTTDVDGDARPGPVTDQGADEFVNRPPVAKISAPSTARQQQLITFSAAGSADPDGPLKEYRWTFSDGTTQTTSTPQVVKTFLAVGLAGALLRVVDLSGTISAPVTAVLAITDGVAPLVSITKPANGASVRLTRKRSRKRATISFGGGATDASGVKEVLLSLRHVARGSCRWLDPSRGLVTRSCRRPVRFRARAGIGSWTYVVPSKRSLRPGTYELTATAVDNADNASAARKVRFSLR